MNHLLINPNHLSLSCDFRGGLQRTVLEGNPGNPSRSKKNRMPTGKITVIKEMSVVWDSLQETTGMQTEGTPQGNQQTEGTPQGNQQTEGTPQGNQQTEGTPQEKQQIEGILLVGIIETPDELILPETLGTLPEIIEILIEEFLQGIIEI